MSNRAQIFQSQTHFDDQASPAAPAAPGRIVCVGSCFMDYIAYVDRLPCPGETLHSSAFVRGFGGKGANQAVAAARLGAPVQMVACVGADHDGSAYVQQLKQERIDTRYMKTVAGEATGLAMIAVDNDGRNCITICPNAASMSTPEVLLEGPKRGPAVFKGAKVVMLQHEIPLKTTIAALEAAKAAGVVTMLNTAPAPTPEEASELKPHLKHVDLLCANEHEAKLLTGVNVTDFGSASFAAQKLQYMGAGDVVITLGADGAAVVPSTQPPVLVPGIRVQAVDTTGAGDCFVGALARFMAGGDDIVTAAKKANFCAGRSVGRRGTQVSYPSKGDVPAEFFAGDAFGQRK